MTDKTTPTVSEAADAKPTSKTSPPKSPTECAIECLEEAANLLRAEAGFRGAPGEQIYDCYRIIRLAERCKKAAEKLSVARSIGAALGTEQRRRNRDLPNGLR